MTPRPALASALVGSIVCLVVGGCDSWPGRPTAADREMPPAQVVSFDTLYRRNCAGCHGQDGRLGAARPLNDPIYIALVPQDRLRAVIADGMPGTLMPAFAASVGGDLTETQIDVLVKGMRTRWERPDAVRNLALPPYAAEVKAGDAERARGAAVYAAACARCHAPESKSEPKGGSIVDASFLALVSDQSLRTTVIAGRPDLGKPDWREDIPGQPLTPEQISDVVAWLAGQRRPVSGRPVSAGEQGGAAALGAKKED